MATKNLCGISMWIDEFFNSNYTSNISLWIEVHSFGQLLLFAMSTLLCSNRRIEEFLINVAQVACNANIIWNMGGR